MPATGIEFGGGLYTPGIDDFNYPGDNPAIPGPPLPSTEFVLFSFSVPVDLQTVIVDDISNFDRTLWAAGGAMAPNLNLDLVGAFAGYTVINSQDDATDGLFTHVLNLKGIQYLAIGAPIPFAVGDIGPFKSTLGSQFEIVGFGASTIDVEPEPNPAVPEPATLTLLGIGVGLAAVRRRKLARCMRSPDDLD